MNAGLDAAHDQACMHINERAIVVHIDGVAILHFVRFGSGKPLRRTDYWLELGEFCPYVYIVCVPAFIDCCIGFCFLQLRSTHFTPPRILNNFHTLESRAARYAAIGITSGPERGASLAHIPLEATLLNPCLIHCQKEVGATF